MQIKIIEDQQQWDNIACTNPHSTMFLSWAWGEFERENGFPFFNYGVFQDQTLVGLLPIKIVKAVRGSYLHLRHGPLINWQSDTTVQAVKKFLIDFAHEHKVAFIRVSPLLLNTSKNLGKLQKTGFKVATNHMVDAELTQVINLQPDRKEILMNMRKNTRNTIRKAEKVGVHVKHTDGNELFDTFFAIYQDTVKRQDWVAYSKEYIKKEYDIFRKYNMARMFVAYYQDQPVAASLFTYFNKQSIYHHSGSLTKFRNIPGSYLIQWEAMQYAKKQGYTTHNLWGVSPADEKNHPWYGLSMFKRGFGGEEKEFVHAHDYIIKPFAHLTRIYEWLESKWRGY